MAVEHTSRSTSATERRSSKRAPARRQGRRAAGAPSARRRTSRRRSGRGSAPAPPGPRYRLSVSSASASVSSASVSSASASRSSRIRVGRVGVVPVRVSLDLEPAAAGRDRLDLVVAQRRHPFLLVGSSGLNASGFAVTSSGSAGVVEASSAARAPHGGRTRPIAAMSGYTAEGRVGGGLLAEAKAVRIFLGSSVRLVLALVLSGWSRTTRTPGAGQVSVVVARAGLGPWSRSCSGSAALLAGPARRTSPRATRRSSGSWSSSRSAGPASRTSRATSTRTSTRRRCRSRPVALERPRRDRARRERPRARALRVQPRLPRRCARPGLRLRALGAAHHRGHRADRVRTS